MSEYKSEASINKMLAAIQMAGTAIEQDTEEERSFEYLLREALRSENEAIKIYIELRDKSEALGSTVLVKAFDEIKKDEQVHVGNLQYLMKLLCTDAVEVEQEGEKEEADFQAGVEE